MTDEIQTDHDHGPPRYITIYNGDDVLGGIAVGRTIRAVTPDGVEIGKFETIDLARLAVVRVAFGGTP